MRQSISRAVARTYEKRREEALARLEQRKNRAYARCPQLENIDQQIAQSGARMLQETLQGEKPQETKAAAEKKALLRQRAELLQGCGIPADFDRPRFQCSHCRDTGFENGKRCHCYRQTVIPHLIHQANLQPLTQARFEQFDETLFSDQANPKAYDSTLSPRQHIRGVRQACEKFVRHFEEPQTRNLLFVGSPGTGKSFLMGCIGHALIEKGFAVLYASAPQLFDQMQVLRRLRTSYHPDPVRLEQAEALHDLLMQCDLLLIDDLGTESQASQGYTDLLTLLDERQRPQLKTIISSNAEPADLRKTYDERVFSRLVGQFAVIPFFGRDLRFPRSRSSESG